MPRPPATLLLLAACSAACLAACSAADDSPQMAEATMGISFIVGGISTDPSSVPYQVRVFVKDLVGNIVVCGGSVLSPFVVLTAAHCTHGNMSLASVRAGSPYINRGGQVVPVAAALEHPKYNPGADFDYDVSVLRLAAPLALGDAVATIGLVAPGTKLPTGTLGRVAGWGMTAFNGSVSDVLQSVALPSVDRAHCSRVYSGRITPRMMCFGGQQGSSACTGDSGGPMVVNGVQVAVVSWQLTKGSTSLSICGSEPDFPTVYADMANTELSSFVRSAKASAETMAAMNSRARRTAQPHAPRYC